MKEEMYEDGISIGELFSIVWKKKIVIACITLVTMLAFAICTMVVLNPSKLNYESTFELRFPGIADEKYPSGILFDYRDIISDENLNLAKESKTSFSNINIENLTFSDYSIVEKTDKDIDKEYEEITVRTYQIIFPGKIFKNEDQAKEFIQELINIQYNQIIDDVSKLRFDAYLEGSKEAETFETQLSLLNSQKNAISSYCNGLISDFGNVIIDGVDIQTYKTKFEQYFLDNSISLLQDELQYSAYIKNESNKELYVVQAAKLTEDIEFKEELISELKEIVDDLLGKDESGNLPPSVNSYPDIDGYNNKIANLREEVSEMQQELNLLNKKIGGSVEESLVFSNKLDNITNVLTDHTNELTKITKEVYEQFITIRFSNKEIVQPNGTISVILATLVGGVLAGGTSCVAFVAVDLTLNKNKKEEEKNDLGNS